MTTNKSPRAGPERTRTALASTARITPSIRPRSGRRAGADREADIPARDVVKIAGIVKRLESRLAPQIAADEAAISDERAAQGAAPAAQIEVGMRFEVR